MELGVISDIHGNLPALEAVLDALTEDHSVTEVVCLGDIVGIMGWPQECVQLVREECVATVLGNHDRGVVPPTDVEWALKNGVPEPEYGFVTEQLDTEDAGWLRSLPETALVPSDTSRSNQARLVHSHPDPEIRWSRDDYVRPRKFSEMGTYTERGTLLLGHLHKQHAVELTESGLVLNPGSIGQPHTDDAEYAVVNTDTQSYSLHRTAFPTERVRKRLREMDLFRYL